LIYFGYSVTASNLFYDMDVLNLPGFRILSSFVSALNKLENDWEARILFSAFISPTSFILVKK